MSVYVACRSMKLTNGLFCWTAVNLSSSAWNLVVASLLLSRMMKISGGFSWMDWPQKPSRLYLFAQLSSFADCVVVVRVPAVGIPSRLPLPCCMFATVAMMVPNIS